MPQNTVIVEQAIHMNSSQQLYHVTTEAKERKEPEFDG